jgi:ABC-type transport system substrate-binding protein
VGNWIGPEYTSALKTPEDLPLPEYNPEKARQLLAAAGVPRGFEIDWFVPFPPYFDFGERIVTDLGAIGIRGKLQVLEGPAYRSMIAEGRKGFKGNRTSGTGWSRPSSASSSRSTTSCPSTSIPSSTP